MKDIVPLGEIITTDQKRDAIHIAIEPIKATEKVFPGQSVGADGTSKLPHVGIVDPFLANPVFPGQKYFICLFPNTITSLHHVWEHPAFQAKDKTELQHCSERYLRDIADEYGITYQELMDAAADYQDQGRYFSQGGRFEGMGLWGDKCFEFWKHWEQVTEETASRKENFFSCSC